MLVYDVRKKADINLLQLQVFTYRYILYLCDVTFV